MTAGPPYAQDRSAGPLDAPARLALVGCTASGKSALAAELARSRPGVELLSADSMQVYRGMDIGTAKPSAAEQTEIRHHLIDLADPSEDYSVSEYQQAARRGLDEVARRGASGMLVGGTGLYVQAVVDRWSIPGQYPEVRRSLEARVDEGTPEVLRLHAELERLDPVAAARMEPTNARRVVRALEVTLGSGQPFSSYGPGVATFPTVDTVLVGLTLSRAELDRRIADRYRVQMDAGFLDEVRSLLAGSGLGRTVRAGSGLSRTVRAGSGLGRTVRAGSGLSRTAGQALGYKELADHLDGQCSLDEAVDRAILRTRQFARRQERWFRRDPRIVWLEVANNPMEVMDQLLEVFDRCS